MATKLNKFFIAPGNYGTSLLGNNVNLDISNFDSIKDFIIKEKIDLLIVGPDTDDDGKPVLQKKGELIMPLQGLIRADAQIKNVLNQLTEKGVLKKKDEQKGSEKLKN